MDKILSILGSGIMQLIPMNEIAEIQLAAAVEALQYNTCVKHDQFICNLFFNIILTILSDTMCLSQGDELILECIYNSTRRDGATFVSKFNINFIMCLLIKMVHYREGNQHKMKCAQQAFFIILPRALPHVSLLSLQLLTMNG